MLCKLWTVIGVTFQAGAMMGHTITG